MKTLNFAVFLTFVTSVTFVIVLGLEVLKEPKVILVTDYQLELMQKLKDQCEIENPNKECILMFDYWAVEKYVE